MKNVIAYLMMLLAIITFSGCGEDKESDNNNTTEASLNVTVTSQDGALLNLAKVSIADVSGTTNEEGEVTLGVSLSEEVVVKVSQAGFVNQAVTTPVNEETNLQVVMIPVKETLNIANIEQAQVIKATTLNAQITLPTNALVDVNGNVAEGNVTLNLTPWDITNSDIAAMLGNGQALTLNGERVELISAGMMSVSFYDENGNYLQLAPNTTAQLQMDLPIASINNEPLAEGSTIPLWYFDEEQGLWTEEGTGTVVASVTSPVGLAVQADVPHFSTWNWDFYSQNPGSVNVKCLNSDQTPTACNVIAEITLEDGSKFTRSKSIPLEGATVVRMPSKANIVWKASFKGLLGLQNSGVSGDVVITLEEPTTSNFVQCKINGKATACTTKVQSQNGLSREYSIPADGATIQTAFEGVSTFTWDARSFNYVQGTTILYYTGQTTSNTTQAVIINLDTEVQESTKANTVLVGCVNGNGVTATTCDINVGDNSEGGDFFVSFKNVPIGSYVTVTLPENLNDGYFINFYGAGKDDAGQITGDDGNEEFVSTDLKKGQIIDITLNQPIAQ